MHCLINSSHQRYTHWFACGVMVTLKVMNLNKLKYLIIGSCCLYTQYLINDNCSFVFCLPQLKATCYLSTKDIMISCKGYQSVPLPWCNATAIYWYCSDLFLSLFFSLPHWALYYHYPVSEYKICTTSADRSQNVLLNRLPVQRSGQPSSLCQPLHSIQMNLLHSFTRWRCSHCWWEDKRQAADEVTTSTSFFLNHFQCCKRKINSFLLLF